MSQREHSDLVAVCAFEAFGQVGVIDEAGELEDIRTGHRIARDEHATGQRSGGLTIRETGEYLGCSSKAVYARIDRGRIPVEAVRRMGRTVTIDRRVTSAVLFGRTLVRPVRARALQGVSDRLP